MYKDLVASSLEEILTQTSLPSITSLPTTNPFVFLQTTVIMVRILSIVGFLLTIAVGVQAQRTQCQCLFTDDSHCCVVQVSPSTPPPKTNIADMNLSFSRTLQAEAMTAPLCAKKPRATKTGKPATLEASLPVSTPGSSSSANLAVSDLLHSLVALLYRTEWQNS